MPENLSKSGILLKFGPIRLLFSNTFNNFIIVNAIKMVVSSGFLLEEEVGGLNTFGNFVNFEKFPNRIRSQNIKGFHPKKPLAVRGLIKLRRNSRPSPKILRNVFPKKIKSNKD